MVSRERLTICQRKVHDLRQDLFHGGKSLNPDNQLCKRYPDN